MSAQWPEQFTEGELARFRLRLFLGFGLRGNTQRIAYRETDGHAGRGHEKRSPLQVN